jgi:hypothetical protein
MPQKESVSSRVLHFTPGGEKIAARSWFVTTGDHEGATDNGASNAGTKRPTNPAKLATPTTSTAHRPNPWWWGVGSAARRASIGARSGCTAHTMHCGGLAAAPFLVRGGVPKR